jgi:hypothetical protein
VHVVVAVDPRWPRAKQPVELFQLRRNNVPKRPGKARVKYRLRESIAAQKLSDPALVIEQAVRNSRRGKRRREIQVKRGVHSIFLSQVCATLRIRHEHHGAGGRHRAMPDAFENSVCRLCVLSPVVCIDDEDPSYRRRPALTA